MIKGKSLERMVEEKDGSSRQAGTVAKDPGGSV
jgi:hypothetical protein